MGTALEVDGAESSLARISPFVAAGALAAAGGCVSAASLDAMALPPCSTGDHHQACEQRCVSTLARLPMDCLSRMEASVLVVEQQLNNCANVSLS